MPGRSPAGRLMSPAKSSLNRIVVVGGSVAGATAAGALRQLGYEGSITMVGDERYLPYSRPALSKGVLTGTEDIDDIGLAPLPDDIDVRVECAAVGLDRGKGEVLLDDGQRIGYDGLVVATGARAARLADIGAADPGAQEIVLRDLDDARTLAELLAPKPRVLVIGGGILGTEVASACAGAGCEVLVVGREPALVPQLGHYLANLLVTAAQHHGVRFVEHPGGVRLVGSGLVHAVELADGSRLEADVVITAVGCRPNVEWLSTSGLPVTGGIRVDERCRVDENIVAAGDVASFPGPSFPRRTPLWTHAIEQGTAAASALLTGDQAIPLTPRPYFWTEQFGMSVKVCGHLPALGEPDIVDGALPEGAVLRWLGSTAATVNRRVPIGKLRALAGAN
ncbi:NAD(P)/FAD-dependent oxidoreductase [Rhodococcus koreensis]|uniref:NAD(P)/FAD-dependent oxidoreductase n=1 Tax=Rhodococcus koreensis TaxID=99653 RepID=UPI00366C3C4B